MTQAEHKAARKQDAHCKVLWSLLMAKALNADQSGMWVAMMNGIANRGFTNNLKRLRRDLAELEEMVRLGAGIPGDEQRIEMIKGLFARLHKMAPVVPLILAEIESDFQTWH